MLISRHSWPTPMMMMDMGSLEAWEKGRPLSTLLSLSYTSLPTVIPLDVAYGAGALLTSSILHFRAGKAVIASRDRLGHRSWFGGKRRGWGEKAGAGGSGAK